MKTKTNDWDIYDFEWGFWLNERREREREEENVCKRGLWFINDLLIKTSKLDWTKNDFDHSDFRIECKLKYAFCKIKNSYQNQLILFWCMA